MILDAKNKKKEEKDNKNDKIIEEEINSEKV